jgi:membrane protein
VSITTRPSYDGAVDILRKWRDWWRKSPTPPARWLRAAHAALLGEMPVLAAGTALFAITAAVPALAAVVSLFGLVADAHAIESHVRAFTGVLPPDVVTFLADQLERQAERSSGELGAQLVTSVVLAMISARGSVHALVDALNRAYRVRDVRGALHRFALSFVLAAGTLVGLLVMLVVVVALPVVIDMLELRGHHLVHWLRWPAMLAVVFAALAVLYRFAPSPRPLGTNRHVWPGAAIATVLLVIVSFALSEWVGRVANYELFYGAFGSVIVIVLWFYLSVLAVVVGGFVNAELERGSGAPEPSRSMY